MFVSLLPTPDVVEAVVCGPSGLLEGASMRTFVDLSTTGPTVAARLADRLQAARIAYLDAPVSGGPRGAASGRLTVMASGATETFARLEPLLQVFGENVLHVGEQPGAGLPADKASSSIPNFAPATAIAITGEALALGVRGGLDPTLLLQAINASSGRNTASADKYPNCVLTRTFDYGFRLRLMAKDVALCLEEAGRQKTPMMLLGSAVEATVGESYANAGAEEGDDCTGDCPPLRNVGEREAGVGRLEHDNPQRQGWTMRGDAGRRTERQSAPRAHSVAIASPERLPFARAPGRASRPWFAC